MSCKQPNSVTQDDRMLCWALFAAAVVDCLQPMGARHPLLPDDHVVFAHSFKPNDKASVTGKEAPAGATLHVAVHHVSGSARSSTRVQQHMQQLIASADSLHGTLCMCAAQRPSAPAVSVLNALRCAFRANSTGSPGFVDIAQMSSVLSGPAAFRCACWMLAVVACT
jgi:hypothetical protein